MIIGKSECGPAAIEAIRKDSAAYLVSKPIKDAKVLTFADLGMETIYEFRAKNMPVTVALDRYPAR